MKRLKIIYIVGFLNFIFANQKLFAQFIPSGNYIRVDYDNLNNRVDEIRIYKDSILVWTFYQSGDTVGYSKNYIIDSKKNTIGFRKFIGKQLIETDSNKPDSNGVYSKYRENWGFDNCVGKDCVKDKYGRLIEGKIYNHVLNDNKLVPILYRWDKFYYFPNMDFSLIFNSLLSK